MSKPPQALRLVWKKVIPFEHGGFASVSLMENSKRIELVEPTPTATQLLKHPVAIVALLPKDAAVFAAGALSGAAAKTVTAPLDLIKLIMQTHGLRVGHQTANKAIGFIQAFASIGKQEGIKGYWKDNFAQVVRVLPYSAVQLFAYDTYKKLFRGTDGELSLVGRLAAGACAGMTSTFVTYPLDVLRLRLAVDPGYQTMSDVFVKMVKEEGLGSFYRGLGPSLIGIAPYLAVNFCVFDLVKKSLPEKFRNKPEASIVTAFVAASIATLTCYPLDTIRRQMQMRGIVARDGVAGLYRGFVPNALKTLPNSSIKLTIFDGMKRLISTSEIEFQRIMEENRKQSPNASSF
ncbi:putative envelope ADP,ATP carrier protein, chloroplastic isoform X2 [Bidens hawaiensis]|uniref:putative envelope ADP,ATP carrier protein, chloroplastic isoform X2 n=1 Tax=Bidens hawaiensis TaxID=980011 RepID=UPI00404B67AE